MSKRHKTTRVVSTIIVVALLLAVAFYVAPRYFPSNDHSKKTPTANTNIQSEAAKQLACIENLPLKTKLAQKIMVAAYENTISSNAHLVADTGVGGIIIMNAISEKNIAAFKSLQAIPPFIAVDQEGGTVQRYPANGELPGAADMINYSTKQAYNMYLDDYKYLASLGITTNFAPVVDVAYANHDPLPGRIYSDNPEIVASYAAQSVKAAQDVGITPVIKHFPGLGSTSESTDFGSASSANFANLKTKDLIPYQILSSSKPDVMVSNAIIPGLSGGQPASLSHAVITDTLRAKYGYKNTIIYTDSLTAKAIHDSLPNASVRSWKAGADIALIVQVPSVSATELKATINKIINAGIAAAKAGEITSDQLDKSLQRIFVRKHVQACEIN